MLGERAGTMSVKIMFWAQNEKNPNDLKSVPDILRSIHNAFEGVTNVIADEQEPRNWEF